MKKIFVILCLFFAFSLPTMAAARDLNDITDWYIKSLDTEIIVNKDSSLDVTEDIVADCGQSLNKHGIFRVIPYQRSGDNGQVFKTPIKLSSITDQNGVSYDYTTSLDRSNYTVTWKIGDAGKSVTGENRYIIKYHVDNAIRMADQNFDELYWNLNGSFWELEIDSFAAKVIFPDDFDGSKGETNIYSGLYGQKSSGLESFGWSSKNIFELKSSSKLTANYGITASITSPKGYFKPYDPPFFEKYGAIIYSLIPLAIVFICYRLWRKFGLDPRVNPTVAPEFEIPEKLSPLDMGMIISDGAMSNNFLTAGIVNLAVKGKIKIEESSKGRVFKTKDYVLHQLPSNNKALSASEEKLLKSLFSSGQSTKLSDLKNKFYKKIPAITESSMDSLVSKGWLIKSSRSWMMGFISVGIILGFFGFFAFSYDSRLAWSLIVAAVIILIFSPLMKRRSMDGALLNRRIKGFELYIKKAETYRQQWLEKQNVFEEFLPYAILFGVASQWIKNMKSIYGEEFFNSYHPIWYYGYVGGFNFNEFDQSLSDMSSKIGSTLASTPSSSGSGGGGFSGGGGGGGGGGGW